MSNYNGNFIAYGTLEALLALPVSYLNSMMMVFITKEIETVTRSPYIDRTYRIIVQKIDEQNNVHLWKMTTGRVQIFFGEEEIVKEKAIDERTDSALAAVESYLKDCGCEVHKAAAGRPRDLPLIDGTTDLFFYDKEQNAFIRKEDVL